MLLEVDKWMKHLQKVPHAPTYFTFIGYMTWNGRMTMNDELGRMWKKAVVAYLKVLILNFP
jgi:hypothetical protein